MPHSLLKTATLEDIDELYLLVQANHQGEDYAMSEDQCRDVLAHFIKEKVLARLWLIYVAEKVVGYAAVSFGMSLEFAGRDAFLDEMFLLPDYRGQGIGSSCLAQIKIEMKQLGIRALHLEVTRNNQAAIKFYQDMGFNCRDKYMLMTVDL